MKTDTNPNSSLIERLFSAGAHFGFTKSRRHPTVRPYIFGTKNGTDIFDLEKTAELLQKAKDVLTEAGKNGKIVVCVSTKDETSALVTEAAKRVGLPYVTNRWIGGMMTNWTEIKKRLARLAELAREAESGELERKYTKKERVVIGREVDKLTFNFGGIRDTERTPDMMLVVDPRHDVIAVREAIEMKIPVVAITSSDNNLAHVTYPVVVNDTLQPSVALVLNELIDAYAAGKAQYTPKPAPARTGAPRARTPRAA
ncbi:MAG: 30S ribosomal protein S2 [Candidatus Paceibacterota bacterium]